MIRKAGEAMEAMEDNVKEDKKAMEATEAKEAIRYILTYVDMISCEAKRHAYRKAPTLYVLYNQHNNSDNIQIPQNPYGSQYVSIQPIEKSLEIYVH